MTKQFQGMWVKSFAAGGTAFDNAPLQIDVDGSLTITDATIILNGSGADIVLDPITGQLTVTATGGGTRITMGGPTSSIGLVVDDSTGTPSSVSKIGVGSIELNTNDLNVYEVLFVAGEGFVLSAPTATTQKLVDIYGYTGATANGPVISFTQLRGTGQTPTATQSGDTIGGLVAYGYDGAFESNPASSIISIATENHGAGHGAKLVFSVTPNGSTSSLGAVIINSTGEILCDSGAAPDQSAISMKANALGALELLCFSADNGQILFDEVYSAGARLAADTSIARIRKNGGFLTFLGATGQVVGTAAVDTAIGAFDLATGDFDLAGVYRIGGTQVVGPRLSAVTAPTITTANTALTAGATYTANEQNMLNQLKTSVGAANTCIVNLQTTVNDLRSRLSTTGITA